MAAVTFSSLTGLVIYQLENSIQRQELKLEEISDARLAAALESDVRLVAARLEFLFNDTERRISAIAARADTIAAVASRNVVAMSELLGPAAVNAEVDGIVVLDHAGNIVGASSDRADLIGLRKRLTDWPLAGRVKALLERNDPSKPKLLSELVDAADIGELIPGERDNALAQMVFVPLFDDFGDVSGGLIAQRWLQRHEETLIEFSKIGAASIAVFHRGKVISLSALDNDVEIAEGTRKYTNVTTDGRFVVRCGDDIPPLRICALKPVEELYATQNELTKIGKQEEGALVKALVLFGIAATILFIGTSVLISRQVTRPLTRITQVVSRAAGNYEERVDGTERSDEVGNIARAVVVLQASVKERDSLRANILVKNKALKRQESELRVQNVLFDAALNNMSHGLCMFDADRRLIVSNQSYLQLFDLTSEQVVPGMSLDDLMSSQNLAVAASDDDDDDNEDGDGDWPSNRRSSVTHRLSNGRIILTTRQPLADGGWVAIYEDITERQQARDRLVHLAKHDSLTNLPNRVRMREHLSQLLRRRESEGGDFGLLCLDLDEFKTVNDSLGHPVGDALLREVADRLLHITTDRDLVVRLGGDEFAIVTDIPTAGTELARMAQEAIADIARPFQLDQHEAAIGVSIGISMTHGEQVDADELFKQADLALYQAKADGRNTYRFFEAAMETNVSVRRALITDLRSALDNNELEVFYQPQIDLGTGVISGFEALMRWRHPERGLVSPAEFIPIAEETGLIVPMGEWILREACKTAATWPIPVRVGVNLSGRQLKSHQLVTSLIQILATTGLPSYRPRARGHRKRSARRRRGDAADPAPDQGARG